MADLNVAPRVLRWARMSLGLDLSEAAEHMGFPPLEIDKWESGAAVPTLPQLKRLARGYRRQLATLLLAEPPTNDEPALPDFRLRADYKPPRLSPGLHLAIRLARLRQQEIWAVARDLAMPSFPVGTVHLSQEVEAIANEWRTRLQLSVNKQAGWKDPYEAWRVLRGAIERTGTLVLQMPFGDDNVRGFSLSDLEPSLIAISSSDAVIGRIFTLFHEVAHLLLGDPGLCEPPAALRHPESSQAVERFCKRFAGALLVPLEDLRKHPGAAAIANSPDIPSDSDFATLRATFKVSAQVIWYRLRDAQLITDHTYYALWAVWASRKSAPKSSGGPAMDRPERAINLNGRYFVNLVLEAQERGLISFADALDYVRIKESEMPKLVSLASASP